MPLIRVPGRLLPFAAASLAVAIALPAQAVSQPRVKTLYSFQGGSDAAMPAASLTLGADGSFYGTSESGGAGFGAVFKIDSSGSESLVYRFLGGADGATPEAPLLRGSDGNFYGTTVAGGTANAGTIFCLAPSGQKTVLYSFPGGQGGAAPWGGLVQTADGNFYGTTTAGGTYGNGTLYRLANGRVVLLHAFSSATEGDTPYAGLSLGSDGNLYGSASAGGRNGGGTVFRLTPAGGFSVLHTFGAANDGANPKAPLTLGSDGNFYGTTFAGGANGGGTVFKMTPTGQTTVLYSFAGGNEGIYPAGALAQGSDGSWYGTTQYGGGTYGNGTVYRLAPGGGQSVLHVFSYTGGGLLPAAGLIPDGKGHYYGVTQYGGNRRCGEGYGCGVLFELLLPQP